jgi:hypothetical protein
MQTTSIIARDSAKAPVRLTSDDDIGAIKKALKSFQNFDTLEAAVAALNKASAETDDFKGLPIYLRGVTVVEGKYAPEADAESIYDGNYATVALVAGSARGQEGKSLKAVLLFPTPKLETILGSTSAQDWLAKVVNKEQRHVAFRPFRDAASWDELDKGFEQAPVDLESYLASHARGAAEEIDSDTFDTIWPAWRKGLTKSNPKLAKLIPPKQDVIKGIRSESYAKAAYPELEAKNLFTQIAASIVGIAKDPENNLDASAIIEWAQNRKTTNLSVKTITDDDLAALDSNTLAGDAASVLGLG